MFKLVPLLVLPFLVLPGCMFIEQECDGDALSCVDAAITDNNGDPDGCDLAACVACVDACSGACLVLESYPPRYTCADASFDVYDFCPTWQPPQSVPSATDVVDLGCGAGDGEQLLVSAPSTGRIDVTHYDFGQGCCPDAIVVDVAMAGSTLGVTYTPTGDDCDCVCNLDVSYAIVDVPPGTWTLQAGLSAMTATVTVQ